MVKVFVSSTVFDVLDVRSEVEHLLRDMGLVPVLSGSATSGFQPATDQNSIETCLVNLAQCDSVIVILSQRYGPSLKGAGFPDVSATHLEYNEAKRLGKPIRMYVRDRLEADYSVHKKNKKDSTKLLWVGNESDHRLFELLAEHRRLAKDRKGSNWFDTFRDSIELKALVKRDYGPVAARSDLESLVMKNQVPIISVDVSVEKAAPPSSAVSMTILLKNVGTTPAYKLSWVISGREEDKREPEVPILAPHEETRQFILSSNTQASLKRNMTVTYYMAQGHYVRDIHSIGYRTIGFDFIASGTQCLSKKYHVASGGTQPFVIEE